MSHTQAGALRLDGVRRVLVLRFGALRVVVDFFFA